MVFLYIPLSKMVGRTRIWTVESLANTKDNINFSNLKKSPRNLENDLIWPQFWIFQSIKSYCETTSLHGYNYITRTDTTKGEKKAWICIVVSALVVATILLWISWNWNEGSPTVTVIESTHFATWNIPFPAVTICNFNKISAEHAKRLATTFKKPDYLTVEELMNAFRLVMDFSGGGEHGESEYLMLYKILDANKYNAAMLVRELAPTCNEMLLRCMWKGTQTRCDTLFQPINTTEGMCCSFNYHAKSQNNYPLKLAYSIPKEPRRVTACGYQTGLSVLLKPKVADYFSTHFSSTGFRVLIHDSYDYADDNAETKVIAARTEGFISISPESTYATEDVRYLKPKVRNCLFYDERKLGVLQRYSYTNCLAECRSKYIYDKCNCVPPNFPHNSSLPECKMDNMYCVVKNRKFYIGSLPGINASMARDGNFSRTPCGCLPDCELLQYPAEVTTGVLNRDFSYNSMNFFKDTVLEDETLIHVYFNDLVSTHYRKDIFQNWLAILGIQNQSSTEIPRCMSQNSSFGGLLGLILGFSIVTGFEFIYYLTVRPFFDSFSN